MKNADPDRRPTDIGDDANIRNLHARGADGVYYPQHGDASSARAARVAIGELRDPVLKAALAAWRELCGLGMFDGQSFVGRRMRDFPASPASEVAAYAFTDAVIDRCPVAHEIEGMAEDYFIKYQRIAFPILDDGGELFEMLTVASEVFSLVME